MMPLVVLAQSTKREYGKTAQVENIKAGKTVKDVVKSCLGPGAMLKILMDPMGGIVITNDGNSVLREIDVTHPAAKSLIELSRAQDEEVGDGTTSVVVLAGELLDRAEPLLFDQKIHPTVVVEGYFKALNDSLDLLRAASTKIDTKEMMLKVIESCVGSKFSSRWGNLLPKLALDATERVKSTTKDEVDIKRYAKVEKIPGGEWEDSCVLSGVMLNKNTTHPAMRRNIKNPRIVLLDCTLEYKKGESQTMIEVTNEEDWDTLLQQEEDEVRRMCNDILSVKPDVVITEKGVSDLAQHFLIKGGASVIRRVKKTDNNRIAKITGATIVNRTDELTPEDVGTLCGLFDVQLIGDEYYSYFVESTAGGACTILLRGGSKDVLNEVERNLQDAMCVARNLILDPYLLPGGGAIELEISSKLQEKANGVEGLAKGPYKAMATALEVIPKILIENAGAHVVQTLAALRSKHATAGGLNWGIDGEAGKIADVSTVNIWDTYRVKEQMIKSAVETACSILRIDDVLSGVTKKKTQGGEAPPQPEGDEAFGDVRDG